ncbi:MAG: hypothetical protein CL675_06235 [Bdellovibrionaceae bacterium]|nr:hypothetical protein [Pseudobdellovibrionaceae bacterium]
MSVDPTQLKRGLFALRLGVFIVFFMWTIDKFINPGHTVSVFKRYYLIEDLGLQLAYVIGAAQLLLVLGFLVGVKKRLTYGALLLMHSISTISTWQMYLDPWGPKNLLFFAAFPMLAAIYALYILRDADTLLSIQ